MRLDVVIRWWPRCYWVRLVVEPRLRRGDDFESGTGLMYAGMIWRCGFRIWPLNIAVLALLKER